MMILLPMVRRSPFFRQEDYYFPAPLIDVDGKSMIERVVDNLKTAAPDVDFRFLVNREDAVKFSLPNVFGYLAGEGSRTLEIAHPTRGALCTCLMAFDEIDPAAPLIIANSDQVIDVDLAKVVEDFRHRGLDAGVITFDSIHPRWSYVRLEGDAIVEAHEKKVISRHAIAGFYYFARGADFIEAAEQAILNGAEAEGAYYISSALNEMILAGKSVGAHQIAAATYHSFYSPEKIAEYVRIAQSAAAEEAARASAKGAVTVVIPMAGQGSRFAEAGYEKPKPFIDVAGRMMIERVIANLALPGASYLLLARDSHLEAEPATAATLASRGDVSFLSVKALTEGAACTVLLGRAQIDNDRPLLIANCDQIVDFDCAAFVDDCLARGLDGSILVFRDADRDPKWSFARIDAAGLVEEVKEKQPISDLATVGLYFFRRGADFVAAATDMIVRNDRSKNEFYVAPAYNYAIAAGKRIGVYEVDAAAMHGIGTPADLDAYLAQGPERAAVPA